MKKPIDYNSIEYLRSRGVEIGENVHLFNTNIDFGHGFLVSIGNNVTLTGVTVLAHDASTQIPLGVSKVGKVRIGNNVFVGISTAKRSSRPMPTAWVRMERVHSLWHCFSWGHSREQNSGRVEAEVMSA